ncbi:Auxin-responsive protein [Actinidia chinensis var. chinensis]|uniref:Auxin-responsive protein n=1 Tax=Actinidia chinensis var. chinensis TaxID=1590841 RepID=A0A2R6PV01_ACTCC|nr:Auxin-responsive protein [Actinidia chinensis var. chinensis]
MEGCSKLLDLIPKDREWLLRRDKQRSHGCSEEKNLELRLGPPGGGGDEDIGSGEREDSMLSLGYFSNNNTCGAKRGFKDTVGLPAMAKESSQPCCNKVVDPSEKKKAFSPASADTAVLNSSQKKTAPASVVGWPPIRSFRKNLASSSSFKQALESQNAVPSKVSGEKPVESCQKGFFVKINMDGVPIGRKVDLAAYDSYEKLSIAVDELFRDLLAAQRDTSAGVIQNKQKGERAITGLLDGNGEYTLVYEDNEGDRVLVGDVPWHMFVSTVKRLRVLKSSELHSLCLESKQEKIPLHADYK